ncbi:hypothetical protein C8Q75DRAFT_756588 [Abortiporus biennis]|nr:hypothetical protein C8Q75DRAFT_756588 [Abortiporus biennis]
MSQPGPEVDLEIVVYGSKSTDPMSDFLIRGLHPVQGRLEVQLRLKIPTMEILRDHSQLSPWIQKVVLQIAPNLKHTQQWFCEFCDKPARETVQQVSGRFTEYPPKFFAHIHNLCDTSSGECVDLMRGIFERECGPLTSSPGSSEELNIPFSASCMFCHDEATAHKPLNRCSNCKLTRYYSVECQRTDWKRHKTFCKMLKDPSKNVMWYWP